MLEKSIVFTLLYMLIGCNNGANKLNHHKAENSIKSNQYLCFNDFKLLHPDEEIIEFERILIQPYIEEKIDNNGFPPFTYIYNLNEKWSLKHITSKIVEQSDSISILGTTFNLREIINKLGIDYNCVDMTVFECFEVKWNNKIYVLLLMSAESVIGGATTNVFPIIIKISDHKPVQPIALGKKGESLGFRTGNVLATYPTYLGDFNSDGDMDYVHFPLGNSDIDTIYSYTFKGDHLEKISENFLILKRKIYQITATKGCYSYKLDLTNSHWFFNLKVKDKIFCDTCYNFSFIKSSFSHRPYKDN